MLQDREKDFEELYKYYPRVLKLVLNEGYKREDAEDLAQQVFTRVYKGMDEYRGESKVAFLDQVTKRLIFNDQRDKHAKKRDGGVQVPVDDVVELPDTRTLAADAALEAKERSALLYKAIEQLRPEDQTVIRYQLAGLSCDTIAKALGISVPALKSRLNIARKHLREIVGEELTGLDGGDGS